MTARALLFEGSKVRVVDVTVINAKYNTFKTTFAVKYTLLIFYTGNAKGTFSVITAFFYIFIS